jgi:hypothetical protein
MANMGVIKGYPEGDFRPDASITRAELAVISARFAREMYMDGDNNAEFNDISGHWAMDDIIFAAQIGLVSGYPDGTFKPEQPITRAEFITLVNRVLEREPQFADALLDGMKQCSDNSDEDAWYYLAVQEATNSHLFERKEGQTVPRLNYEYERWIEMIENWDWLELEKQWIERYSRRYENIESSND